MKRIPLALLSLLVAAAATASTRVLVPVFVGGGGVNGAVWRTRLTVFNRSDAALTGIPVLFECPIPEGCPASFPARASIMFVAVDGFGYQNGFFLDPGVDNADVWYSLRVYDQSRTQSTEGTDVPVVPVSAFSDKPLEIVDVPADPVDRVMLRIYADPPATPRVRVTVLRDPAPTFETSSPAPAVVKELFADLQRLSLGRPSGSFSVPSGAAISDLLNGVTATGPLRIEVASTDGTPIWALATFTNNETQNVTIAVPRTFP